MRALLKRSPPCLIPALAALLLQAGTAAAAASNFTIDVDSTSALPEVAGACTLKSALRAAAFRLPSGNCPVPAVGETPVVRLPVGASIVLDNTDNVRIDGSFGNSAWVFGSTLTAGLVIEGRGASVRRSFNGCDTTSATPRDVDFGFLFASAGSTSVEIRDLALENFCNPTTGLPGGAIAISSAARVALERLRLLGNVTRGAGGGARIVAGRIEVRDSLFDRNSISNATSLGFALAAAETALPAGSPSGIVLERNTFTGQAPGTGFIGQAATVRLSVRTRIDADFNTFSGNSGDRFGLSVIALSGLAVPPVASVRQNTLIGSSAGGGGLELGGAMLARLLNNLLLSPAGGSECGGSATVEYFGPNQSDAISCIAAGWTPIPGINVVSTTLTNSGGLVPTLRLSTSSPAIDASTVCALPGEPAIAEDVRGVPRPQDGNASGTAECDVGATEYVRNAAPVLSAPATATTAVATPLLFTLGAGNALRVADADARALPVEVELSVSAGGIRFGSEAGLTCGLGGGVGGAIRRCHGTLAALNAGLEGARFDPPAGFSGNVQLTVRANDLGNGGDDGNPLGDQRNVAITVQNQTPLLTLSPSPVDFGNIPVGNGRIIDVTLSNSGNLPLQLDSLATVGDPIISIDGDTCPRTPASLAPGESCFAQVQFFPSVAGTVQASLVIQSNAPSSPDLVLLTGTGTGLANLIFRDGFEP